MLPYFQKEITITITIMIVRLFSSSSINTFLTSCVMLFVALLSPRASRMTRFRASQPGPTRTLCQSLSARAKAQGSKEA